MQSHILAKEVTQQTATSFEMSVYSLVITLPPDNYSWERLQTNLIHQMFPIATGFNAHHQKSP